jgi:hypothetical protein
MGDTEPLNSDKKRRMDIWLLTNCIKMLYDTIKYYNGKLKLVKNGIVQLENMFWKFILETKATLNCQYLKWSVNAIIHE